MTTKQKNTMIISLSITTSVVLLAVAAYYIYRYYRALHPAKEDDQTSNFTNMALTRPLRNNNPLNIRISNNNWLGKIPVEQNTDKAFEQFTNIKWGTRAAMINLRTYYKRDGLKTIRQIISKWAPEKDNNLTESYIKHVSQRMAIPENQELEYNKETWCRLVAAMAVSEGAGKLSQELLDEAWSLI